MKKNSAFRSYTLMLSFALMLLCCFFLSACNESAKKEKAVETIVDADSNFPQIMVGVWEADVNDGQGSKWAFKIEPDGSISKMEHCIFGPLIVKEGGVYRDGQDSGTFIIVALGPVETVYSPVSKIVKLKIVVDSYEMKLPAGSLEGRMIDTFVGTVSEDGKTWQAEWRNYGWLEGATEPNIAYIDKNPNDIFVFRKLHLGDQNSRNQ